MGEAQKKVVAAKAKVADAGKKATETGAVLAATEKAVGEMKAAMAQTQAGVKTASEQLAALQTQLQQAQAAAQTAEQQWLARARAAEDVLKSLGEWVSFTDEIAPIFYKRCLACHNARTSKGRFNMESFAAIMKGGESGEALVPGDSDDSNLCIQVEDGSMPLDSDPLTPEQIQLIARWVDLGAKLDAGANPDAPLIQIMPKFPQPPAPESYAVPIPVTAVQFSPDGTLVASSGYHELLLWNAENGELVRRISNVAERIYDIEFHPDGKRVAIAAGTPGQVGEVKVFRVEDGELLADLVTVEDAMFGVAFSPDGARLAACGADRSIRIFESDSGKELVRVEDHADWVMDIAWSPDGSQIASASRDKTSKLFDAASGDAVTTFNGHGEPVFGVAFLPDGKQVATSGRDKSIRIWTTENAKEARRIRGFGNEVFRLVVLPDQRIFSCSADKTARLHQANDGKALKTYSGHADWVYSLDVHAESGRLVTGCYTGNVRIWSIDEAKPVQEWTAAPGHAGNEQAAK
ncbi:MAG: c-type cytochrome domain-containing protein [Maioricimonas sp. JB045]